MGLGELYNQLGDLLVELLNNPKSLDLMTLCDSFIIAFLTNKNNSNNRKLSFQISEGNSLFSIEIDMDDSNQIIQSINIHKDN